MVLDGGAAKVLEEFGSCSLPPGGIRRLKGIDFLQMNY